MRAAAVALFLGGLLLWVRVMFFGVRRQIDADRIAHRRWPLASAAFFAVAGAALYVATTRAQGSADGLTWRAGGLVLLAGVLAAAGAAWLVQRSAAAPSSDPDDDPRYRFQGHVARVTQAIGDSASPGRVAFEFEGRRHEIRAIWATSEESWTRRNDPARGLPGAEVVIERMDGELAYVEPWTAVEERL